MTGTSPGPGARPEARAGAAAVRVLSPDRVAAARAAATRAVVRPHRWADVAEVVHPLAARRPVVVELDELDDQARRRALDVMFGVAYGLEASVSDVDAAAHAYLCEPGTATFPRVVDEPRHEAVRRNGPEHPEPARDDHAFAARETPARTVCALCDLRAATTSFSPPLEMVILRDGSRIWAPPAHVCDHCRSTIRHWRFAVAWCPACERWGRRGITSACGAPYGA
jgi:FtsZ-interacting cell division protein YlmF